jgi:DNA processing protein
LLRDGATLVESAADICAALRIVPSTPRPVRARPSPPPARAPKQAPPAPGDLIGRLQERLGVEPLLVDELIRQCHATSSEVQQALLELELEGRIERHPGNRVSLASF